MSPITATIDATSHHEAGHAVLVISTGIMEVDAPITYAAGSMAAVPITGMASRRIRFATRGGTMAHFNDMIATVSAGGFAAEWRYHQDAWQIPNAKQMQLGAHGDLASIVNLFGSGHWNAFRAKADVVISDPVIWGAIQKLASVLLLTWPNPVSVAAVYAAVGHVDPGFPRLSL